MKKLTTALVILAALTCAPLAHAQQGYAISVRNGTSDPAQCQPISLNVFYNRTSGLLKLCTAANTWTAISGGTPTAITVADTTDATSFIGLFESATGDLGPKTDAGATYNASTGAATFTSVVTATRISPVGTAITTTATAPATAASTTEGVDASLTASNATAGNTNAGAANGGDVAITAGDAARFTSGNGNGGAVYIESGAKIGAGSDGFVQLIVPTGAATVGLPTRPAVQINGGVDTSGASSGFSVDNGGDVYATRASASSSIRLTRGLGLGSGHHVAWGSGDIVSSTGAANAVDTGVARSAAGVVVATNGGSGVGSFQVRDTNGGSWTNASITEAITLSTLGTTTDSSADLLPANSIIHAVTCRITTTITTATDWSVGDPTTAARFSSANATLTAGTTSVGLNHMKGGVSTEATGPTQTAAAKLRITTTGTPGAGAVRCTTFYSVFVAPTS